jgi:hypothetical protein
VRVVALTPYYGPEAVVSTFVHRVVTRLAEDDAVVHGVCPSELHVSNVMGLRALAVPVLRASRFAKSKDMCSAARAPMFLTRKDQLLSRPGELVRSRHLSTTSILSVSSRYAVWFFPDAELSSYRLLIRPHNIVFYAATVFFQIIIQDRVQVKRKRQGSPGFQA